MTRKEVDMLRSAFATLAAIAMLFLVIAPISAAGGYTHGHGDGSCLFVPSSGVEGQPFQVYASGLPTDREVDLLVTNYEVPTHSYGPLAINADGTYSGTYTVNGDGKTKFQFTSPSTNATRLSDLDASCTITLAPA
jgi:hypothetical protein